jgi:hypothetical protein
MKMPVRHPAGGGKESMKIKSLAVAGFSALAIGAGMAGATAASASPSMQSAPLAGTCTIKAQYSLQNVQEIFGVESNSDSCSGGGQEKYQGEYECSGGPGPYFYGKWTDGGVDSPASDGNCAATGHHIVAGYIRVNENNPYRVTCFVPGDSLTGLCPTVTGH